MNQKTGRIISQKNPSTSRVQSRLIKEYDCYDTQRITNLKSKYRNQAELSHFQSEKLTNQGSRMPLTSILNETQNGEATRIKHKLKNYCQSILQTTNKQVSKVQNVFEGNIKDFRDQVGIMNSGINHRLDDIEERIRQLKDQSRRNREIQELKLRMQKEQQKRQKLRLEESIRKTELYKKQLEAHTKLANHPAQDLDQMSLNTPYKAINEEVLKNQTIKQSNINDLVLPIEESCIALKGEVKKGQKFTKEFTMFINRLKDQIKLDRHLTKLLLCLKPDILHQIRTYILRYHPSTDISYFQISPIEIDPLQIPKHIHIQSKQQMEQLGDKCYKLYLKICDHYEQKLHRKYSKQTIDMLFEEMGLDQISLGHIISYINMRTQQQFRNRDLVKLLRRINICTHVIERGAFYHNLMI